MKINIADIRVNDVLSEVAHYIVKEVQNSKITLVHIESGKTVDFTPNYVQDLLKTADQYQTVIKVGWEDKKWTKKQIEEAIKKGEIKVDEVAVGDIRQKGIKSIWNDIHSTQVFTVCFKKQDKIKTKKELEKEKQDKLNEYKNARDKERFIVQLLENPILDYIEGEDRILRGYKKQFTSEDGTYICIDMDITDKNNERSVNLNTISWLVFDGTKYELE